MSAYRYQHCDQVIEAARNLRDQLLLDSPFGNEAQAQEWLRENHSQIIVLAAQHTEAEARAAGKEPA